MAAVKNGWSTPSWKLESTLHKTVGEEVAVNRLIRRRGRVVGRQLLRAVALLAVPALSLAQASPFMTGMTSLQTNILAWLTPVAIILVMVLGAMAMASRVSWGWCIGAIFGIAIAFGAPQIVAWVRGMFGV